MVVAVCVVEVSHHPLLLSALLFEVGSLLEPAAHPLSYVNWPVSIKDLHICVLQCWGHYSMHTTSPSCLRGQEGQEQESSYLGGMYLTD